ncbi:hypothetical protein BT69DRAFT_1291852 [Atractiella rhizophila]|nr:hypothetical protein BT69DRAFT_1291852 [Atractiella rhizophila]
MFKLGAKTWVAKAPPRPTTAPPETSLALASTSANVADYQVQHGSRFSSQAVLQNRIQSEVSRLRDTFPHLSSQAIHEHVAKKYGIVTATFEGEEPQHPYANILDQRPRRQKVEPKKPPSPAPSIAAPSSHATPSPPPSSASPGPRAFCDAGTGMDDEFGGYEMSDCENFDPMIGARAIGLRSRGVERMPPMPGHGIMRPDSTPLAGRRMSMQSRPMPSRLSRTNSNYVQAGRWGQGGDEEPIARPTNVPSLRRERDSPLFDRYPSPAPSSSRTRSISPTPSYNRSTPSRAANIPLPPSTIGTPAPPHPVLRRTPSPQMLREGLPASPRRPRTVSESLQQQERETRRRRLNNDYGDRMEEEEQVPPELQSFLESRERSNLNTRGRSQRQHQQTFPSTMNSGIDAGRRSTSSGPSRQNTGRSLHWANSMFDYNYPNVYVF